MYNKTMLAVPENPFSYDLGVKVFANPKQPNEVTICCHGYGYSNQIAHDIAEHGAARGQLVGFNFPDYGIADDADHAHSVFGSIDELLPLLYLMHFYACVQKVSTIHLYGFSAGGGAVINALAVLNQRKYLDQLSEMGIKESDIPVMLAAIERGSVILDCPLKSIQEIVDYSGMTPVLQVLGPRYERNRMNPIESVAQLAGLKLRVFLHFQDPDDVIGNRDDQLFIERLQEVVTGSVVLTTGSEGGHELPHGEVWERYATAMSS